MGHHLRPVSILSRWPWLVLLALAAWVSAQSSNSSVPPSPSLSSSVSLSTSVSFTTSSVAIPTTIHSGNSNIATVTVVPVVLNSSVIVTPTPTSSTSSSTSDSTSTSTSTSASTSASASASSAPIRLDTRLDPGFGVLGALLIITGIPCAFLGHKNRWTTFFLSGFYTLSLVCLVLILQFGVLNAVNPPSTTVRGLFVLSCGVAGIAGGGVAIFFWKAAKYFIGAWGGFAFALWVQCFKAGGLVHPLGFRWIMYIGAAAVGFTLCTIPKMHYHILLVSTAFVGSSAFMLGVDCFTSSGLKEFYIWNLGFNSLFPKYTDNGIRFPVTQTMQVELGLMGAVALMGIAIQFRVLHVLKKKLQEIETERKQLDEDAEARAAAVFEDSEREKEEWEREHPTLTKDGRMTSGNSSSGFLKEDDATSTPRDDHRSSAFTLIGTPRQRYQSGLSEFRAATSTPTDELDRPNKFLQSPGALPVLDLGADIENDVPKNYLADSKDPKTKEVTAAELEELRRKEELLVEIQSIRRSIDRLRIDTPDASSSSESRHPSLASRFTFNYDLGPSAAGPSHVRPPRENEPRTRVQSVTLSNMSPASEGPGIGRPTSVPLQDDWNSYVRDRKLLQPPSGVTAPIPTSPFAPVPRVPLSPAVAEALMDRQRRESMLSARLGQRTPDGSLTPHRISTSTHESVSAEETPIVARPQHRKSSSQGGVPGTILPPQRPLRSPSPQPEISPRVLTFEELQERHRQKLKELQDPITQAQREQADLEAAKQRWERAKALEKRAVMKRQAEKAEKRRKSGDMLERPSRRSGHGRSLSADVLAEMSGNGSSSKRTTNMKVQDWRKSQQDLELGLRADDAEASASRRKSAVPFPNSKTSKLKDPYNASSASRA
ncbi:hypothetical protein OBBRIDRAFT_722259 [Obba rivulosa]|uniref:TM7S3/TM198-like domain-containing protein n=1 Tax=Obba rivulosa TaxID=1052685 RepID=A0A8E2DS40_9APHY|nr:hypothetical protein OBBRIDRAFT_722259 [Obba rivulosa]